MFTPQERHHLRQRLISRARGDQRLTGVALTGSAAVGAEDCWSDIDLAFGIAENLDVTEVIRDWTDLVYREHGALHHLDVVRGATVYRVFLLDSTLQVDLAFAPAREFGAIGPTFQLLLGTARDPKPTPTRDAAHLIGWGWLYALHARSSILRGRGWQAEYMISGVRDQVLALACLRHDLPTAEGRGFDSLPTDVTSVLAAGLVRSIERDELLRAFRAVVEGLCAEIRHADSALAGRLAGSLRQLVDTAVSV